ncbi:hypothetical protein LGN22_01520 [Burkholderia cenocepacia]|uniref:Uncharacterized protein n=1 Tax=Burkholderia cenocepacia TaxID=95486 RepID=A0AAW4T739_9BURK|nr:hypothetical protein [Burkholderia cenocepacia]MCA8377552.1 hypothetical protein [Burkholderia cenocepacia]
MQEVTKLKRRRNGGRRPCDGGALRNKAEQWSAEFLPAAGWPIDLFRRGNPPGDPHEMFHALYMPTPAATRTAVAAGRWTRPPIAWLYCDTASRDLTQLHANDCPR